MIAKGARLKDRYRLERLLGRGGMAAVWLASDEVLDRPVAIKLLSDTIASDPEFLARFRREARVAAGLTHPNLIGVYDYAEADERPYLVMEYVPGENLAERMSSRGEIDCQRLARELLGALAHIHAAGIVHRDIKPGNVLLAPDGSAKLIDFGIALPRDATALTRTGHLLGTARYIAPEVMSGKPATEQADLYSCGVVLRDCLGNDPPPQLRATVARLSAEDPEARPRSAREALAQIERKAPTLDQPTEQFSPTLDRPTAAPASEPPTRRLQADGSRFAWGRAAAAVAALAALAIGFFVLTGGSDSPPREQSREQATADPNGLSGERDRAPAPAPEEPEETEEEAEPPEEGEAATAAPAGTDPTLGSSLNQEGFELIQAGAYDDAVPVLEEAVRSFPADTEDIDYAYALFNLGNALRLAGRPEEAIPVLEQRLEIPNQTGVVRNELAAAESEAGR